MELKAPNGTRTDHDRDPPVNGVNGMGAGGGQRVVPEQDKATAAAEDVGSVNGGSQAERSRNSAPSTAGPLTEMRPRMNDLPDEIVHITQGFVPLSVLLTRLAQVTHNSLQEKVAELAKMAMPAAAVNGNSASGPGASDDSSNENLRKKGNLAGFAQDLHGKWLKALVITEWSRKSDMVSKLIDLKFHINQQRILFDAALENVVNIKRDLTFARMPSPDLKTALQVLSTGTAPWMPDLNYIEPPPLTPGEQLKWISDLNTLLSIRLNLEDYDKIPYQFRNFGIASGRVTFKVDGEFEVDLTIADEDFEKQFWFIDFRYAFRPAASSLPESLRAYVEGCVNAALGKDGLAGCYQFLHEFVLTSKINELKRQAFRLSRGAWAGTLMVEPLNRALAIQYWTSRAATMGSKSWILVAVDSGRKANGKTDPKALSFIVAKWYRDNKEVKDGDIEWDAQDLSAESLLKTVIGRHVEFILTGIRDKLLTAARFRNREASMLLHVSKSDPAASSLTTQVGYGGRATLLVEPTGGVFSVKPQSRFTVQFEHQMNNGKNPAEDGAGCLENVRCAIEEDELNWRASSAGWLTVRPPLTVEDIKSVTKLRDWTRAIWLQKDGWGAGWVVAVLLGFGGDEWWLLEAAAPSAGGGDEPLRGRNEAGRAVKFKARLSLQGGYPQLSEAFWGNLALLTTGMMTQAIDQRELHRHGIKSKSSDAVDSSLPRRARLPPVEIWLSSLFPSMVSDRATDKAARARAEGDLSADNMALFSLMQKFTGTALTPKRAWADDVVTVVFRGIQSLSKPGDEAGGRGGELTCVSDAVIRVQRPVTFAALKGMIDGDVSYDPRRGEFSLRIRRPVGQPVLDALKSRTKAIDRFVNFFEALANASGGGTITSGSVTLRRVTFYYGDLYYGERRPRQDEQEQQQTQARKRWRVALDLTQDDIDMDMEDGNPHLRVVDLMRRLVNSDGGIGALMAWLPASLPALRAIEEMETRWGRLRADKRGQLEFSMKTMAWISLGYDVATGPGGERERVALEVRVTPRRGEAWWRVWRSDAGAGATPEDGWDRALKPIWDGQGDGWIGLGTGAAGRPAGGVVGMLLAVDDAIRGAVPGTGGGPGSAPRKGDEGDDRRRRKGEACDPVVVE